MDWIDWIRFRGIREERVRIVRLENGLFDALPESQAEAVERRRKLKARKEKDNYGSRK